MAFRREKFVPRGGPSGGDGGKGGDIVMESSERHNTLVHFRFNPEHTAQRGRHGEGSNKTGRDGEGIVLKVPVGTIVFDDETGDKLFADYPFTTLQPNLGVVAVGDAKNEVSFVVADIPGLIEGAHQGAGLGTQFLRHIERTRLLVHLVDVSDSSGRPDVAKDVEVIVGELASFGAHLEDKPMIMAASKIDAVNKDKLAALKRYCKKHKHRRTEVRNRRGSPEVPRAGARRGGWKK